MEDVAIWGDRPEARIYPATPVPGDAASRAEIALTAPVAATTCINWRCIPCMAWRQSG